MSKRSNVENVEVRDNNLRNLILFILVASFTCACIFIAGAGWACDRGGGVLDIDDYYKCVGLEKVVAYEQNGILFVLPEGELNASFS